MNNVKDIMKTMEYGPAPESDIEVQQWLDKNKAGFAHYIDGKFVKADNLKMLVVNNPATDEKIATIPLGNNEDVDNAVKAARQAYGLWSKISGHERAKYLYAIARNIQKKAQFFAVLESIDNGKTIRETRDIDIPLVVRHFYHHAGWAEMLETEFEGYDSVGVCGQVIPWNFPLLMLAWKVAPALAAGNTIILKPADLTPLTAIAFAEICAEIGLPKGVVNIVHGDGSTGAAICGHNDINKIAFTGSTQVGRAIRQQTAGSGKKLSLELGGKSPFIVFEDADIDAAVEGVVDAIWFNQGEVCCAGSRILVQQGIADKFYDKLKIRMQTLRVGNPLDKTMDMGAIVSHTQRKHIDELVQIGQTEGAELISAPIKMPKTGSFYSPSLFLDVETSATIWQEEIFGPVVVAATFRTPSEAVILANNSRYGLSTSIWSENINLALDIAAKVKTGIIWVNATNLFDAAAGFGGYRESGYGREGGREGMFEYLVPTWEKNAKLAKALPNFKLDPSPQGQAKLVNTQSINRTAKNYIGGKQTRPDGGHSYLITAYDKTYAGEVGLGNRKDIRNAVEAARKASGWSSTGAHNRAQVLYYLAENLDIRRDEFVALLMRLTGVTNQAANWEFELSIRRIFYYAAQADKYDGAVHSTATRHVTIAMKEAWGIMGLVTPEELPLLSLISLMLPAISMGNRVVLIPSERHALIATSLYQIFETSDLPAGVVNIVTGEKAVLSKTLAEHDEIASIWYMGDANGSKIIENLSAGNLKSAWVNNGKQRNWLNIREGQGSEYLRRATQIKNIWIPYGE